MSGKSEAIIKFEEALNADENLQRKYEAALKKIVDEGLAQSDGEAMVKAASELGFEISIEEMERAFAEMQELDDQALDDVAGGEVHQLGRECNTQISKVSDKEDEKGHNLFCLTIWHCFTATVHTETDNPEASCWKGYACLLVNK